MALEELANGCPLPHISVKLAVDISVVRTSLKEKGKRKILPTFKPLGCGHARRVIAVLGSPRSYSEVERGVLPLPSLTSCSITT